MTWRATMMRDFVRSIRFHRQCKKRFKSFQNRFADAVYGERPIEVLSGPFAGMAYFNRVVWGPITPKWLGSYEFELHDVVTSILEYGYPCVIDIGCAEGYYAVGIAVASPKTEVLAFDTDFKARRLTRELARTNAVTDRVHVMTECTHHQLAKRLGNERGLVISDIEGAEVALLDPRHAPVLAEHDILVECHQFAGQAMSEVSSLIAKRFDSSHEIQRIDSVPRCTQDWKNTCDSLLSLADDDLQKALDECRPSAQTWLWMRRL